jgi:hypothetical protein
MQEVLVPLNDGKRSLSRSNSLGSNSDVDLEAKGKEDTLEYRIHAKHSTGGKTISLWHDINLTHMDPEAQKETPYYNFICEIPKFTRYACIGQELKLRVFEIRHVIHRQYSNFAFSAQFSLILL